MSFLNSQDKAKQVGIKIEDSEYSEFKSQTLKPLKLKPLISFSQVKDILQRFEKHTLYPVGVQGKSDTSSQEGIGSMRATVHDIGLAKWLSSLILPSLTPVTLTPYSPVDWQSDNPEQLNYWVPLHVSPVFRYMEYEEGGQHFAHYDSEYKDPSEPLNRTLLSGVLYLTSNKVFTRIINDHQDHLPFTHRLLDDWTVPTDKKKVVMQAKSQVGNCFLFPHRMCHDVSENKEGKKRIIIRFDIFYRAAGKQGE